MFDIVLKKILLNLKNNHFSKPPSFSLKTYLQNKKIKKHVKLNGFIYEPQKKVFLSIIKAKYSRFSYFLPITDVIHDKSLIQGLHPLEASIPVHIVAFIVSSFFGITLNDLILSKTKVYFCGKYLYMRFIVATALGEAIYILISFIVWSPYINFKTQIIFLLFSYMYRLTFELLTLPLSRYVVHYIKRVENVDVYDRDIRYSPFVLNLFSKNNRGNINEQ